MNAEIILLAIGCYLFCGVDEKVYRLHTGDWREGSIHNKFENKLSTFTFIPNETTYEQIIENFGDKYIEQRTHKVLRRQKFNEDTYYFNKELRYIYLKVNYIENKVALKSCLSELELSLFFKDGILAFYYIFDLRMDDQTCREYIGTYNTVAQKYKSSMYNCNKKFYEIFTLEHREKWDYARDCDFHKKEYWEDPIYKDKKYISDKNGWPCTGIFNTSC